MSGAVSQFIVLLGRPGSGKGTQRARLAEQLQFEEFDMGQICRQQIKSQTDWGLEIRRVTDAGQFVPDALVVMAFKTHFRPLLNQILDGFPRNIGQYCFFGDLYGPLCPRAVFVFIDTDPEVCTARISAGLGREGRNDDVPMIVERRMREYEKQTLPLVEKLKREGNLIVVDGNRPPAEVTATISHEIADFRIRNGTEE